MRYNPSEDVMSFEYWKEASFKGYFSQRSPQLQAVDMALKAYHQAPSETTRNRIRLAIEAWIEKERREGRPNWRTNPRNRTGVFEVLYKQVTARASAPTPQELGLEWEEQYDLQHETLELFRDKQLQWRDGYFRKLGNNKWGFNINGVAAAENIHSLSSSSGSSSSMVSAAQKANVIATRIVDAIVPDSIRCEVMAAVPLVVPNFMSQLAASVIPFVGIITAAGTSLWNLKNAIQAEYYLETSRTHADLAINFGVPQAALQAVVRILERTRNAEAFSCSVSLAEFGTKLAGLLADAGTATNAAAGLAANVLKLTNIVRILVRDVQERDTGNSLMRSGLKITAFESCPIIGAYYVCCSRDASLLNEILQRAGSRQDNLEEAKFNLRKHIRPMQENARRLIEQYRFVIPALEARALAPPLQGTISVQSTVKRPTLQRQNALVDLHRH